jgi:hypothetical protein
MSIHEAARLAELLLRDSSSMISAAVQDWDHPISQEAVVLADLFDLTFAANSSPKGPRPKPHGIRPFKMENAGEHFGDTGGRTRDEVEALLAAAKAGVSE